MRTLRDMRTVTHRRGILHVETPLGIVNIHVGLNDRRGRRVEAVLMRGNNYSGEPLVKVVGNRMVEMKTVKGGR